MARRSAHFPPLAAFAAIVLALGLANAWAGRANARRDAGITWIDARSSASLQTYVVRATLDGDRLLHFELEVERYSFASCHLERAPVGCTDSRGGRWTVAR